MAPLVAFGIGAFAVYNIYRYFWREWARVNETLDEALRDQMSSKGKNEETITLVKDAKTGEYRVKD